jgi:prophage antirepressor-like protein
MENLQIFNYGERPVRTLMKDGEPWWVLKDACDILGLSTPAKVAERLDDDEKGMSLIHTPGGPQQLTMVNEPGLYGVILRSDKPEARKFKRWLTHSVLPQIRKTGSFGERRKPCNIVFRQRLNMAEAFTRMTGVPREIAMAHAITEAEKLTGEDFDGWKRLLPARCEASEIPGMNATAVSQRIGAPNAAAANKMLAALGLQYRDGKSWRLTEAGKAHADEMPFERNGHFDYRILWRDSVADVLTNDMRGSNYGN